MTPQTSCRHVAVLHSEPIVAAGIAAALRTSLQFEVSIGDAAPEGGDAAVLVCDYERGIELAGRLPDGWPRTAPLAKVVVLTQRPRELDVQTALERGVLGYLVAGCGVDELIGAVRAAADGRRFLCHLVAQQIANSMLNETLTARELDVLQHLARGSCNKAIANELAIAVGTVKAHVRGIMAKLNAGSRTEAASIALQRGLLENSAWELSAAG